MKKVLVAALAIGALVSSPGVRADAQALIKASSACAAAMTVVEAAD